MNTRQPIQASDTPAVLCLTFSTSGKRFLAGLSDGFRVLRADNCLTTFKPAAPMLSGAAVTALHNDHYFAFVSTRKSDHAGGPSFVQFWDMRLGREIVRFDLFEAIRGLRISGKFLAVILAERTVVFQYQTLDRQAFNARCASAEPVAADEVLTAPNRPHSLHITCDNMFALASMHEDMLVLPAQSLGQVQVITLKVEIDSSTKRVLRAHKTALRCMALSTDGTLLATASVQGTLIRVFSTKSLDQTFEFRRGVEQAVINDIAFSPSNRWLACTSDKGTLHVFDLRSASSGHESGQSGPVSTTHDRQTGHRRNPSHQHRTSVNSFIPPPSISTLNSGAGSVTPSTALGGVSANTGAGSKQEYYSLLPHTPGISTNAVSPLRGLSGPVLKPSPFTPRILTDVRSAASAQFYIGDDGPHWQNVGPGGGSLYTWTVAPGGAKKRVKKAIKPLPNDPSGRPPKGLLRFDGEDILYVVGGGGDARWEKFELHQNPGDGAVGWRLEYVGFRRYLGKQYVD